MSKQLQLTEKDVFRDARLGDMIEFHRGSYSHWAVYIGNGLVIHRWGEGDGIGQPVGFFGLFATVSGFDCNKAMIVQTKIADLLQYGGKFRVNNYLDEKYKPLPVDEILCRARSALRQEGYNVILRNCEHFATECRYGQENSRQVQTVVVGTGIGGLLITAFGVMLVLAFTSPPKKKEKDQEYK